MRRRLYGLSTVVVTGLATAGLFAAPAGADAGHGGPHPGTTTITSTGLKAGQVKHVWLIILENKSYDATFTGLNQNSYLWKTLPSQGALLKNYYGTGHFGWTTHLDGLGAGPSRTPSRLPRRQHELRQQLEHRHGRTTAARSRADLRQVFAARRERANGTNGCTLPDGRATLFNQFDAAGETGRATRRISATRPAARRRRRPRTAANNPTTNPTVHEPTAAADRGDIHRRAGQRPVRGRSTSRSRGSTRSSTADAHADRRRHRLRREPHRQPGQRHQRSGPRPAERDDHAAFSWITPDNCSDAHDAVCEGNNLSGPSRSGNPVYPAGCAQPESTTPTNYTGGLYASDLFLKYYIPLIEQPSAFKDGGLIDITFDEANPPFTNMRFNNATNHTAVANKAKAKKEIYDLPAPHHEGPGEAGGG